MSIKQLFKLSLESDGSFQQEIEYAFFIKLDGSALTEIENKAYKVEQQEQWEIHNSRPDGKKATIRVRSIDDKKYVLCSKLNLPDELGKREVELPTTQEMFEHFKVLGNTGTRKKRYLIKTDNNLVWEVDVYEQFSGELHPWCKVDLEVPNKETPIPEWPFEFNEEEAILTQPLKRSYEDNKFIDQLFKEYNLSAYRPI